MHLEESIYSMKKQSSKTATRPIFSVAKTTSRNISRKYVHWFIKDAQLTHATSEGFATQK